MVNALLLGKPDQSSDAAFSQAMNYLRCKNFILHHQIEAFKELVRSADGVSKIKTAKMVFLEYYTRAQGQMLRRVFLKAFLVTTPMPLLFLEAKKKKLIGRLDSSFAGGCIKKQNDTVFFGINTM
jgi:hypothetical protein